MFHRFSIRRTKSARPANLTWSPYRNSLSLALRTPFSHSFTITPYRHGPNQFLALDNENGGNDLSASRKVTGFERGKSPNLTWSGPKCSYAGKI
ncbi:hypothetical protein ACTXT7_003095 [Hymenolepis weldensis]